MEPSAGFEPAPSSLPGTRSHRWSYEGVSWAPRARTWKLRGQSPPGLPIPPPPIESHLPGSNGSPVLYKRTALPAELRWRDVPGAIRTYTAHPSRWYLLPLGYEDMRASGRPRTACLPLTRGTLCQMSYRGVAAHRGFEPRLPDSESSVLPIERMGIECGRRESNALAARFELARYPGSLHSRMVRRQGLEPRTFGLRVRRSNH